jgi:hypothetical protein
MCGFSPSIRFRSLGNELSFIRGPAFKINVILFMNSLNYDCELKMCGKKVVSGS